jgi:DNA polymerase-4
MTEKIAFELRQQQRLTGCVTVKIRYSDFETHDIQKLIPYTNTDHELFKVAHALFTRLFERRQLIRLVGIRFSHLIPGTYQINLFEDRQEMISLYQSIDHIKKRFGEGLLIRGRSVFHDRNI